ncbi:hypothetical protein ES708_17909 [subsurface metagenome]
MTREKAIEILQLYMKPSEDIEPVDLDSAVLLGIEALECIQKFQDQLRKRGFSPLPGETES